ncbi:hypothetical protein SAMN04488103_102242 [Gemmobacter aquatilis]|uniref:Hemolysin-type calcium-binding repeat-containing protein n=1 Tax=Gemmobacter aquatilis TaxID=933059 RepID=A0A1H8BRZ1_9RHOB|nr:calcium-binding protein [Gemmobacter aquatilis]SEM84904.1 hypothetical protein SAMN04488103_102242 [Gemmobacter aquatilis]
MARITLSSQIVQDLHDREIYIETHPEDFNFKNLYQSALNAFDQLTDFGPTSISLASKAVSLTYKSGAVTFKLAFTGSGIGPVSSMDALIDAIDSGMAEGRIDDVVLTRNGTAILSLALSDSGYTLRSGPDFFTVTGALPTTFDDLYRITDLLSAADLDTVAAMTNSQRTAYFDALSDFGITGLSLGSGTKTFASFTLTEDSLTLSVAGFTLTIDGTFPTDFGALAATAWQIVTTTPDGGFPDLTGLSHFALDKLTFTGPDGDTLMEITGPITDEASTIPDRVTLDGFVMPRGTQLYLGDDWVNGGSGAEVILGTVTDGTPDGFGDDYLMGNGGADVIYAYAGKDTLSGGGGKDRLFGGDGDDQISGDAENDLLDGGTGKDLLGGGSGADRFVFGARDVIEDFGWGKDRIVITGAADSFDDLIITARNGDTLVTFGAATLTLLDVAPDSLDAADFIFA